MSGIGRLRARIGSSSDGGSAVIVLPILGLLVCAGAAALAGIALQPDEPTTPPPSITAAQLGQTCTDEVGALPTSGPVPNGLPEAWAGQVADCIDAHLAAAYGTRASAISAGYDGVAAGTTFDGQLAIVLRWSGDQPAAVAGWVARYPSGLVTVTVPAGRTLS